MQSNEEQPDIAVEFYQKMKAAVTGRISRDAKRMAEKAAQKTSKPFSKGRDPVRAADSIDDLMKAFHWEGQLAETELFSSWAKIVGETNAANSKPETLVNGLLTVRCKSTAWATQLRLMQNDILGRINQTYPQLEVTSIKFTGPDAPSWKKGFYSVPGRGPRDTYG